MEEKNNDCLKISNIEDLNQSDEEQQSLITKIILFSKDYQQEQLDFHQHSQQFSKFQNLKKLCIVYTESKNLKEISRFHELSYSIKNITSFQLIFRYSLDIQEQSLLHIAQSIQSFQNLIKFEIDFYYCENLENYHIQMICQMISNNQNLKKIQINLGWNTNIDQQSVEYISDCLKYNDNLKKLELSFHVIENIYSINSLNQSLENKMNLQSLAINLGGCCKIKKEQIDDLFKLIKEMNLLKDLYLDVYNSQINDQSVEILGDSIQDCQLIEKLYLEMGGITAITNIKQFGFSISKLQKIQELYLNFYNSQRLVQGPFGYFHQSRNSLQKFTIFLEECCSISCQNLLSLAQDLRFFVNLKQFDISLDYCNTLSQQFFDELSLSLQSLKSLASISFCKLYKIHRTNLILLIQSLKTIKSVRQIKIARFDIEFNQDNYSQTMTKLTKKLLFKFKYLVDITWI